MVPFWAHFSVQQFLVGVVLLVLSVVVLVVEVTQNQLLGLKFYVGQNINKTSHLHVIRQTLKLIILSL